MQEEEKDPQEQEERESRKVEARLMVPPICFVFHLRAGGQLCPNGFVQRMVRAQLQK